MTRPNTKIYGGLTLSLIFLVLIGVLSGPTDLLRLGHLWDFMRGTGGEEVERAWVVLMELRLPRVVLAGLVGSALAVAGVLLQAYFKNPLAEPYVLGVSSGAGCGAVLWSLFIAGWSGATFGIMGAAFGGAVLTLVLVVAIGREKGSGLLLPHKLLLAGVALGVFFSSLTTGFLLGSQTDQFRALLTWLMGSVAYRGWTEVGLLAGPVGLGLAAALYLRRELDWLAVDEDAAFTAGVPVGRVKWLMLSAAALLVSSSVAVCGAVAFVGLMVPHALRSLAGASHRHLVSQSALGGAALVIGSDWLARRLLPGVELPLSLVTSVAGALFFLWLLRARRA